MPGLRWKGPGLPCQEANSSISVSAQEVKEDQRRVRRERKGSRKKYVGRVWRPQDVGRRDELQGAGPGSWKGRSQEHQENGDSQRFRGNALGWKASLFMGRETCASRSP